MPFVYSPKYFADIGPHVFPVAKYRLVFNKLIAEAGLPHKNFIEPPGALDENLN